ncbi:MAG: hypothetical protein AMXMBFR47_03180 [Planctomycetota bacterium]
MPQPFSRAALCLFGWISCTALAGTIYVNPSTGNDSWSGLCEVWDGDACGPRRTIQAGVDAAADGDIVILADGLYTDFADRWIRYYGKRITVRSANGPANCIIDALDNGRAFQFDSGETAESVLEGITIRNGHVRETPGPGGAILCTSSSPTIRNCVFTNNRGNVNGGAIHVLVGAPLITGCTFTGNSADSNGGAISIGNGNATIVDCTFEDNHAAIEGGAIRFNQGSSEVRGSVFRRNYAGNNPPGISDTEMGGGVSLRLGTATIRECEFYENSAARGAGAAANGGTLSIFDCRFEHNGAQYFTQAAFGVNGAHTVARCTFRYNSNALNLAGTIEDCTVEDNSSEANTVKTEGSAVLRRCTVRRNTCATAVWGDFTLEDCSITDNLGSAIGGSLTARRCEFRRNGSTRALIGSSLFENCIFEGNGRELEFVGSATTFRNCVLRGFPDLMAIATGDTVLTFERCTLIEDIQQTPDYVLRAYGAQIRLVGTILARVEASEAPIAYADSDGSLDVQYSAIEGGAARILVAPDSALTWGPGNITTSPGLRRNDLHLRADSPCIDAGPTGGAGQLDLDGEPRIADGRSDIGVDEFNDADADRMPDWWEQQYFGSPTGGDPAADPDGDLATSAAEYNRSSNPLVPGRTIWVSPTGNDAYDGNAPTYDGTSGPKATIQGALDSSQPFEGDAVVLLPGTYSGARNRDILLRERSITIRSSNPADPAVVAATIIDPQGTFAEPHRAFTLGPALGDDSSLQGITFRGGVGRIEGSGGDTVETGAAIHVSRSEARLENCVFRQTGSARGAVTIYRADPVIRNCTFTLCAGPGFYIEDTGASFEDCTVDNCGSWGAQAIGEIELRLGNCAFLNNSAAGLLTESLTGILKIRDCRFENNGFSATGRRGALELRQAGPLHISLQRSRFINNAATGRGAAFHLVGSDASAEIEDCIFENNRQSSWGGAMYLSSGPVTVRRCQFRGNQSSSSGGGAVYVGAVARFEDCQFTENTANAGGAVDGNVSSVEFRRCRFERNRTTWVTGRGGAVQGGGTYTDCIFVGNSASTSGAAVASVRNYAPPAAPLVLRRCTFADNRAPEGALLHVEGSVVVDQCAAAANINTRIGPAASILIRAAGDSLTVDYSLIEGGQSAISIAAGGILNWGADNREGDPRFVDPLGGDVRIDAASALLDAGRPGIPDSDLDGRGCPRFNDGDRDGTPRSDIGAVEYAGFIVDDDGPADFASIQAAIDAAVDPCGRVILVRAGVYHEHLRLLAPDLAVISEPGPGSTLVTAPTAGTVLTIESVPAAVVRGFRFIRGSAEEGGGASVRASTAALLDCDFAENTATRLGGGLFASESTLRVERCTFEQCAAAVGAGLFVEASHATVDACSLLENRAALDGGAAAAADDSTLTLSNCVVHANSAQRGGGLFALGGALNLVNSTLADNLADAAITGGGITAEYAALSVRNSILWANGGVKRFHQIQHVGGTAAVTYSCVQGGWSGSGNTSADPRFRDRSSHELDLLPGSPCVDAGSNSAYDGTSRVDILGSPRFVSDPTAPDRGSGAPPIDMGAHERMCGVDLDGDRDVDLLDLAIMLAHYGETDSSAADGDIDGDGDVDIQDLAFLMTAYGEFCW